MQRNFSILTENKNLSFLILGRLNTLRRGIKIKKKKVKNYNPDWKILFQIYWVTLKDLAV